MHIKRTMFYFMKHQLVLIIFIMIFSINKNEWLTEGYAAIALLILVYQIPVLISGVASLFSKPSEYEGILEQSMKNTRVWSILIAIPIMLAVSSPAYRLVPFPSSLVYYVTLFCLFYSIGVFFTQRIALSAIGGIAKAKESSIFGQVIRFATAVHFYPVYLTLSRISSLPWYVRKPIALITAFAWLGLMSMSIFLFD